MSKRLIIPALVFCLLFPVLAIIISGTGMSFLWLLPPALLLLIFSIFSIEKFLLFTVFLVPLSVQLRFLIPETPIDIFLPTELMLSLILIIMVFKTITGEISKRLLKHPVTIIISLCLIWGLITALTGTMPVVSLKSITARLWFVAGFYLLAAEIFSDTRKMRGYFTAYIAGMTPVAIFFLYEMIMAGGFNQAAAYGSSWPFFNDHTSFGASLAFSIPVLVFFTSEKEISFPKRLFFALLLLIFLAAFVLSYSRAAWLSLIVSLLFTLIIILKISWKILVPSSAFMITALLILWQPAMMKLEENRQDSSGELPQHLRSISNITTDASNMERINRWKSAIRMFRERPLLGWGPGTYQFGYAPFQRADEKTIISTIYGEGGNAHSEYLGSLAESGIPGVMLYITLLILVFFKGIKAYYYGENRWLRMVILAMLAGLITYVVHGALNNFLDTDKISALFWGMIAAIVAIDLRSAESRKDQV
jgi:putative inorganic carbon (HCO3(-)) transporter